MARAKRSDRDRAAARRRFRATLTAADPSDVDTEETAAEDAAPAATPAASPVPAPRRPQARLARSTPPPATGRMGIVAGARAAYRPVNLRADLRALPSLVRHRSVWIPLLLSLASTILVLVIGPGNAITSLAFELFTYPPAMAAVFITGFFAPTAAWLGGGIVGLVAAILYLGWVLAASQGRVPGVPASDTSQIPALALNMLVIGVLYGTVLGAAAAWYKRFLSFTSPARTANRASQAANRKPRPAASRPSARR